LTVVVDASVGTAWLTNEPQAAELETLLAPGLDLIAPDLIIPEIGNALWKKSRIGDFAIADAAAAFRLLHAVGLELVGSETLIAPAVQLASRLAHPVYDCLYLVLAQARGAELATLDKRMAAAAEAAAIPLWKRRGV
jgi:predicted nucleic acid-binding protein